MIWFPEAYMCYCWMDVVGDKKWQYVFYDDGCIYYICKKDEGWVGGGCSDWQILTRRLVSTIQFDVLSLSLLVLLLLL